jgi:hypothetical protein
MVAATLTANLWLGPLDLADLPSPESLRRQGVLWTDVLSLHFAISVVNPATVGISKISFLLVSGGLDLVDP